MLTPELLRFLFQYNLWANRRTLDACAALTDDQFTRDLSSSFGSVRDTLAHIYAAEWVWNERFQGRWPSGLPSGSAYPDLGSVGAKLKEMDGDYLDYVSRLTQQELDAILRYKNIAGDEFAYPLGQCLHHVSNHSTYHRGQVVTLMRQLGVKAVATDLMLFYGEQAASARA